MNKSFVLRSLFLMVAVVTLLFACRKTDNFNVEDGTDETGAEQPSVTVDTSVKTVDVSKYSRARVFPGLVCNEEPRITTTMAMDLDYNFVAFDLRISIPPQPQFSTGLYAAPGELVIVDMPAGEYSVALQIGAWTDNLSSIQNPLRDPVIYTRIQLAPGRNYVRNLYGGPIYLLPARPIETPLNITFANVVKSPDFVLGKTSNAEWKAAIAASCVPYIELRSENIIFVVPRKYCIERPIEDPTALMTHWDQSIKLDYYAWQGLQEDPAEEIDRAPLLPWRIVQDIQPVVGYGHSGYPIVTYDDYGWFDEFTDLQALQEGGAWGTYHEIGHNNQQTRYWSWSSLGETSNNLFIFKAAQSNRATNPNAWPAKHPAVQSNVPLALAFAAEDGAKNFDGSDARINDPFARLTPFLQIFDKIPADWGYPGQPDGWGFMGELYKRARRAVRLSLTDQDKRDFVYEALCDYTRKDWAIFFIKWGIGVSNVSRNKMSKYPIMNQEIWKYNPLTRTGGDTFFNPDPYANSNWTIHSFSSEEAGGEGAVSGYAKAIIDGDVNSFWHSRWNGAQPEPPHWIIVDFSNILSPTRSIDVAGFRFWQRQSLTRNIKTVRIEVSNNLTTWTQVAGSPFNLLSVAAEQTLTLPAPINCRYVRLTVPTRADIYDGTQYAALGEFNVIKP